MSFDTRVKDEILKIRYPRKEELLAFLSGVTHTACEIGMSRDVWNMEITSDFDTILRVKSGFEFFFENMPEIADPLTFEIFDQVVLQYEGKNVLKILEVLQVLDGDCISVGLPNFEGDAKMKSAYIAGAFIGAGKIKVPHKGKAGYLVEFSFTYEDTAKEFEALLLEYGISLQKKVRLERTILSARTTDAVADVIYLVGAEKCFWDLQNLLLARNQNENDNRAMNCVGANADRSTIASVNQVLAINKLESSGELEKLDDNLKAIARLRRENPHISLEELGKLLEPPISKSGVNHRMRKLLKIANKIEE